MSVVLELSVPASELSVGPILDTIPEIRIRFDQVVPVGSESFSYVWVNVSDRAAFEEAIQRHSIADSVVFLQQEDGEYLYRIDWRPETDPFLRCLDEVDAAVLRASGTANRWHFDLRFDTRNDVSCFQRHCSERDISVSIKRIVTGSSGEHPGELLSPCQRQTIALALERGFFEIPRRTTMVELAEELGISNQAVSARLRRAMERLARQALSDTDDIDAP